MFARALALATVTTLVLSLPTVSEAGIWLGDLEVTEMTGERVMEEVKTTCRTYHIEETESGYRATTCAEYNTTLRDTGEIRYAVTFQNRYDDTARSPEARFFVPHGAEVVSVDHADCVAGPTAGDQTGVVECFFEDINPRESVSFTVVTTAPEQHPYNAARGYDDTTATVMVFSLTPDWDLTNNTASVAAE